MNYLYLFRLENFGISRVFTHLNFRCPRPGRKSITVGTSIPGSFIGLGNANFLEIKRLLIDNAALRPYFTIRDARPFMLIFVYIIYIQYKLVTGIHNGK